MADRVLPGDFGHLQPLADVWALPTERERHLRRLAGTIEELDAVYGALLPEIEAILTYLNRFELDALTDEQNNLLLLSLSLAEIAPAVQIFREPGNPDGFDTARFIASQ
ncbi:MAG: hypothetical protein EOP61_13225 [Sphingomonadales bacterium]|nr:MAG: hypothetical protein EOP61_13225 [Sphingomonadales bacterium]